MCVREREKRERERGGGGGGGGERRGERHKDMYILKEKGIANKKERVAQIASKSVYYITYNAQFSSHAHH